MNLRAALVLPLLALAACAAPLQPRYYTLSAELPPARTSTAAGYRVAIGPVSVPEALDRPQLVLRAAPYRYAISDANRWAEPLKREIPRVLAQDVAQRLPAALVAAYTQYGGQEADFRVLIDVLRFESAPGEAAVFEAAWSVRDRTGKRLHEAHFALTETVNAAGVEPIVAAHRKALTALAREIADALGALAQTKP